MNEYRISVYETGKDFLRREEKEDFLIKAGTKAKAIEMAKRILLPEQFYRCRLHKMAQ